MGLKTCVTGRSDYYHQLAVSEERSRSNIVWPPMPLQKFLETKAYHDHDYVARSKRRRVVDRTVHGDQLLGHRQADLILEPETPVYGAFNAVLQGAHLGVEFRISAHVGFLRSHGLLKEQGRLVSNVLVPPAPVYEGLVIDDYFCLAPVPVQECKEGSKRSLAYQHFCIAKKKYAQAGLTGSDPKDIVDEVVATVVGAQVDSRYQNVSQGILPVGAPAGKRLSLAWISAMAARHPCTTDALHSSLLGALVSAMCFRKGSMSILDGIFKVVPASEVNVEQPILRPLKRTVAEELILSAVLLPVLVSDAKLPFHPWIFATDASNHKGAVCRSHQRPSVVEPLWQSGDFKGASAALETWEHQLLHECLGERGEGICDGEARAEVLEHDGQGGQVQKPLAQYFDFIEVCGGSGVLSEAMHELGYVVGPIVDLTYSTQYDLVKWEVVEWLVDGPEPSCCCDCSRATLHHFLSSSLPSCPIRQSTQRLQSETVKSLVWKQVGFCMLDFDFCRSSCRSDGVA
jgi:hypothetical protein